MNDNFIKESLFEHRFWLQVLGDHARFIFNTLSPAEIDKIQRAAYFMGIFDQLLEQARKQLGEREIEELTQRALYHAKEIREFKLDLIKDHINGEIIIELPPTFINHQVNEVEEYIRVIQWLSKEEIPKAHPLHYHNLWLPDASGHAGGVLCGIDDVEKDLREKSRAFVMLFDDLYLKADEFSGYLRTDLLDFPALHRLNKQVETNILVFMKFLKEIEMLRVTKKAVGTLMPLLADHMYREECYYLTKLSRVTEVATPDCDPTKPREG